MSHQHKLKILLSSVVIFLLSLPTWADQDFQTPVMGKPTQNEIFTSKKGYSIAVPTNWQVADASMNELAREMVAEKFPKLASLDFNQIDAFIFDPKQDDFAESINIVITPQSVPVSKSQIQSISTYLQDQFETSGLSISNLQGSITSCANRNSYVFDYYMKTDHQMLWQMQYMVPGKNVTYIITCTAKAESLDQYIPSFTTAMQTFTTADAGPNFWQRLPRPVRVGIFGGIFGILFAAGSTLLKNRFTTHGTKTQDQSTTP